MIRLTIVIALVAAFCALAAGQGRNFPTDKNLKTFDTPHFRIIYQEQFTVTAPMIAECCEEAYATLTRIFRWTPEGRIDLLFMDSADTHNGWATVVPHKVVAIYAAGAEPGSSIYQPGNYLRRTIYHELTHVFIMDITNGYDEVMSGIFGRVLPFDLVSAIIAVTTFPPAVLAPRWLLEGVSIWAETEFVPPGRGRSTYADMIFRCAVRDDNLLEYNKWYLEIPHWPFGQAAYLYGMKLIQYIYEHEEDQENPIGDLAQAVSQAILFNLKPAAQAVTRKSFETMAQMMLKEEKKVQQERLDKLRTVSETEVLRLTPEEIQVYSPVYAEDKIYFLGRETERRSTLYRYMPETREIEKIDTTRVTPSFGNLAARPGGRYIYYTRLDVQAHENMWYEIRRYDMYNDKDELITNEGRYRTIAVSHDGRKLAAVGREENQHCLVEFDLDEESGLLTGRDLLISAPLHCDISLPAYSPDGTRICWTEADADGFCLVVFDRQTKLATKLLDTGHQVIMPVWHPVNNTIVFSSDENGVFNLYEITPEAGAAPSPLTHVTGGLFHAAPAPDGSQLTAVGFDGDGAHLTLIPYAPEALKSVELPAITHLWKRSPITGYLKAKSAAGKAEPATGKTTASTETAAHTEENATTSTEEAVQAGEKATRSTEGETASPAAPATRADFSEPEDYNSFTNLRFDFWSPWLTAAGDGVKTGVAASFSEPAGYQDLFLLAGVQPTYGTPLGAFHYIYRRFFPEIHVYGTADQEYYDDLVVQENTEYRFDYAEETTDLGLSVNFPFRRLDWSLNVEAGYEYRMRNKIEDVSEDYFGRPISTIPTEENEGSLWAKATYFDGTAFPQSVSIEDGRWISAGVERSDRHFGGDITRMRYLAEWNEYLPMPWHKNHILKLSASYGFSHGDKTAQGSFSVGGYASPAADIMPGIPGKLLVRGYPDNFQVGKNAARASISYRFPIHSFDTGSEGPIPVYTNQIFGEVFHDAGRTWDRTGSGDDLHWISSTGIEANISLQLLRFLRLSPGIGIVYIPDRARRYDEDDRVAGYISIKAWVNF